MEKFNFQHSLKNIPIPPTHSYMKQFIGKTEDFVSRLRWASYFYLNPNTGVTQKQTYGFKTAKTAPQVKELNAFEDDLYQLMSEIKIDEYRNPFQREIATAVKNINNSDKIFLLADKTTNIYKVSTNEYEKLLLENITKDYKQTAGTTLNEIDREAKKIAQSLDLADRIEQYGDAEAFITIKDHKENFLNDPKCRLINPAKSQLGKISKQILQEINKEIREREKLKQWQSTKAVLEWFRDIEYKNSKNFLQLDVVEFYPSISEKLLDKALEYARTITHIPEKNIQIIKHARRALLFNKPSPLPSAEPLPWQKKNSEFDVTMGAPDGAEVCELVGLLILKEVKENFKQLNFGLYRDDGLAVHDRIGGRQMEKIKQGLHDLFKSLGLRITLQANMKTVDFLDVTLSLETESHAPYRKPNDRPLYVNTQSNHPPTVIKEIPKAINKRLNAISSNREKFDNAKDEYQKALTESGHIHQLAYNPENEATQNQARNKKKRNIIWFNPPFNAAVSTNVGKRFLELIDKHFVKKHPLRPLLNRNTVKIAYSCTMNMHAIIQSHNKKLLNKIKRKDNSCNCTRPDNCPLQGACRQKDVIYHATTDETPPRKYIGSTGEFKARWTSHKYTFRHEKAKNATTLSQHVHEKGMNPEPILKWEIIDRAPSYRKGQRYCNLCLTEKLWLLRKTNEPAYLNKRSEMALRCRHKAKFRLDAVT